VVTVFSCSGSSRWRLPPGWRRARRAVLHLDEHVATANVDVVSGRLAVRGLVAIVGELDEARLTGEVGGELVHEVLVVLTLAKSWSFEGKLSTPAPSSS
jgi:hypothetical protein